MSNKINVEIISARPEDADFIAWIVAQGMHMDGVPSFLKNTVLAIIRSIVGRILAFFGAMANWPVVLSPTTEPHMKKGEGIPG